MKIPDQLKRFVQASRRAYRKNSPTPEEFPTDVVDLVIFHKLHFSLPQKEAWKSYQQLRNEFVDWNEVRISSVMEIQEQLHPAPDSLQLAVFIKDFLEFVHSQRQRVSLESVTEENLTEIRRYFRQIKGVEPATVDLVLMLRKSHPIVPLSPPMVQSLTRAGLVRRTDSLDRKQKRLFEQIGAENAVPFHLHLLNLMRDSDPETVGGRYLGAKPRRVTRSTGRRAGSSSHGSSGKAASSRNGRCVVAKAASGKRVRKRVKRKR